MKDKTFLTLIGLFFLIFIAGVGTVILNRPTSSILRAKNAVPSPLKSFAIIFPQIGTIGDENSAKPPTKIKVSVYLRDLNGNILADRSVKLSSDFEGLTINPADTQFTNGIGQAEFFITSDISGKAILAATDVVSNTTIVNIPTVEFIE